MRPIAVLAMMLASAGCLPSSASALNHASDLYRNSRYQDAAREYQRVIEMDPSWSAPYLGLGNSLVALNQRPQAVQAYQRAVELSPDWVAASVASGGALLELDRANEAIPVLRHAVQLSPDNTSAKSLLRQAEVRAAAKGR